MAYPRDPNSDENDSNHRLYNPYQDLQVPTNMLYKLPTSPEHLFPEESLLQRRSWEENLTYYSGIGYLAGSSAGAAKGFISGLKSIESTATLKLRINRVLNGSGHAGCQIGNRCGIIGILYAGLDSGIVHYMGSDNVINSVVAGLGTGVLYKAASGPRSAAVAGAIGGVLAGLAVAGKQALKRYVSVWTI